jgi:esterase/lipase
LSSIKKIKKHWIFLSILIALIIFYLSGSQPEKGVYPAILPGVPTNLVALNDSINKAEANNTLIRLENEARIIWKDSIRKTKRVILYLHGFSASSAEGAPLHENIAREMGANLYLARLAGHGLKRDNLENFNTSNSWQSALKALAISLQLGDEVVIISTSTGSSFALKLAQLFPEKVKALVNLSPNIRVKDPAAYLLNKPWGLEIANLVLGEKRVVTGQSQEYAKYWDTVYTVNALVELQELLESALREETFMNIHQPVLNLYYFKNEEEQDQVISVDKIFWMHELLATPDDLKVLQAMPETGNHVLASPIKSKDPLAVEQAVSDFLHDILKW